MGFLSFKSGTNYLPIHHQEKFESSGDAGNTASTSQISIESSKQSDEPSLRNSRWIPWLIILLLLVSNLFFWAKVEYNQPRFLKDAVFCKYDYKGVHRCHRLTALL